jgi:hypothetical protein
VTKRLSGDDIRLASRLVFAAAAASFCATVATHDRPRLLLLNLVATAGALLAGIALVAEDSAVERVRERCSLVGDSSSTESVHFFYLYGVWGVAAAILLWHAWRLVRGGLAMEPRT